MRTLYRVQLWWSNRGMAEEGPRLSKAARRWIGVIVVALIGAAATTLVPLAVTAVMEGLNPAKPVSASAEEEILRPHVFIPAREDDFSHDDFEAALLGDGSWREFVRTREGAAAGTQFVTVSVQGESERVVTINRITFDLLHRDPVPAGSVFTYSAGGYEDTGRYMTVDLDPSVPQIVRSGLDVEAYWDGDITPTGARVTPITFPWTVSLEDPLALQIIAKSGSCDCKWAAVIHWQSGGQSGEIRLDNGGKGFRIVGDANVRKFEKSFEPSDEDGWECVDNC
jgi:hypothetical protein